MFLESPHLVSGYYGTIVDRFKGKIFAQDHKLLQYYTSALCYYKIEQFFRSGEFSVEFKKARFHLMMMVKIIQMKGEGFPLNSHKLEAQCEEFKRKLLNDKTALALFQLAAGIYQASGIDFSKRQYKSEADTDILRNAVNEYLKGRV